MDVGLNYHLFKAELKNGRRPVVGWGKYVRDAWLGIDCFNLLGIRNVNSYYWITDIEGNRHGVPNYLTGRQLNLRFNVEFWLSIEKMFEKQHDASPLADGLKGRHLSYAM